jgi:hypothetical protein
MKAIPNKPSSDKEALIRSWSKLSKEKLTYAEARDLDRAFSGITDRNLAEEPMFPSEDNDERGDVLVMAADEEVRSPVFSSPARDGSRSNTSPAPLARPTGGKPRRTKPRIAARNSATG